MEEMRIPESANEWTLAIIESLVDANYFETDSFDFKEFLTNKSDPNHNMRIRKTACAFANSRGGFVVFGVADRDSGKAGRARIVGIDSNIDMSRYFGDQVKAVEPTILFNPQNPPISLPANGRAIFVVHVPRSPRAPHAFIDRESCCFFKRTNRGNQQMSYAEIQEAFALKSVSIAKLTLLHTHVSEIETFLAALDRTPVARLDYGLLDILVADLHPVLKRDKRLLDNIARLKLHCNSINLQIDNLLANRYIAAGVTEGYTRTLDQMKPAVSRLAQGILTILRDGYGVDEQ